MRIHVYQSDSKANCYHILFDNGNEIFFEAGYNPAKITERKANAFYLISHSHSDHSKYAKRVLTDYGGKAVCSQETADHLKLESGTYVPLFLWDELLPAVALKYVKDAESNPSRMFVAGLKNTHDCAGACSFVAFAGKESIFLCLDTGAIPDLHRFIMDACIIEANYTSKRLAENLLKEDGAGYVSGRVASGVGHLSLTQVYEWTESNLKYHPLILLGHRSKQNFDEQEYLEMPEEFRKHSRLIQSNGVYVCDALQMP